MGDDSPMPENSDHARVTVQVNGTDASELRRIALLPGHASAHSVALRALRVGLASVERELRAAARAIVASEAES